MVLAAREVWGNLVDGSTTKAAWALVVAGAMFLWGYFPLTAAGILLGLIILDFLLGFTYAVYTDTFSRAKMQTGGVKIVLYAIAIIIVVALEAAMDGTPFVGPLSRWWGEWVVIYLALTEATSALAHVAKWATLFGVDLPGLRIIGRLVEHGKSEIDKRAG